MIVMNQFPRVLCRQKPWLVRFSSTKSATSALQSIFGKSIVPLHQLQMHSRYNSGRHPKSVHGSKELASLSMPRAFGQALSPQTWMHSSRQTASISIQVRPLATKRKSANKDDNAPLLNEHLIAELLQMKKGAETADSMEVRLVLDLGRRGKGSDDDEESADEAPTPTTQIVTIRKAINIAHDHSLDLMEVSLKGDPPVIKALDFDKFVYQQKRKDSKIKAIKSKEGGGSISDKSLKEFKFRAGITDHDLQRKVSNMTKYLTKGHAVRVTLTARQRMLREDTDAINTTLDRVKELVGDKAVEVRAMKSNDRGSYGNLLLHPNIKK